MLHKYSIFLLSFFLFCSTHNIVALKTDPAIQNIYDLDMQSAFDKPGLFSSEQLSDYIKVVETNLTQNKSLLQKIEASWWKNIAQKIAALSSVGLGGYGYFYWYEDLKNEFHSRYMELDELEYLRLLKENKAIPTEMLQRRRDPLSHYKEHPEDIDFMIKILEKDESLNKKRIADIETIRKLVNVLAPAAILSGLALFGYNLYQSINNQKEKILESINKDNIILGKLKNL